MNRKLEKIFYGDIVGTTCVVGDVNLANFNKIRYKIIKKNILKKVEASKKVFHKLAYISFDFSKLNCSCYLGRGG